MAATNGPLFRQTAVDHYLAGEQGGAVLRASPPWTWALTWTLAGLVTAALVASMAVQVEVTSRGKGVIRPLPGVHTLHSQVTGTVARIPKHAGEQVRQGEDLVVLDSAPLQAQLLEADRQLRLLRTEFQAFGTRQDGHYTQQETTLQDRIASLEGQIRSLKSSVELYRRKVAANTTLEKEGLVSSMTVEDAREAFAQSERAHASAQQALQQARQEMASLQSRRNEDGWKREQDLRLAQDKRDALEISLKQMAVPATADGVLDAVLVKPGEVVQAGQVVGKLVPKGAPLKVVAFLPEKDRAWVKAGDSVRLELEQLPYQEFGSLQARVVRVSDDLAHPQEVAEAFPEQKFEGATYRVELELMPGAKPPARPLRSGMLLNVRFTLRKQRPISIVFEPLRRWLD